MSGGGELISAGKEEVTQNRQTAPPSSTPPSFPASLLHMSLHLIFTTEDLQPRGPSTTHLQLRCSPLQPEAQLQNTQPYAPPPSYLEQMDQMLNMKNNEI